MEFREDGVLPSAHMPLSVSFIQITLTSYLLFLLVPPRCGGEYNCVYQESLDG